MVLPPSRRPDDTDTPEEPVDDPMPHPLPTNQLAAHEHYFTHGDVIRWSDKGYTYAAVYVTGQGHGYDGMWYLSGGQLYYGTAKMSPEQLIKVLRRSHIDQVEFATAWSTARIN
jgi:hypothetical protein